MGFQIVQRPDRRYAIWSTVTDSFVQNDILRKDVFIFFEERAKQQAYLEVRALMAKIDNSEPAYGLFTMTYAEMEQRYRDLHGKD